MTWKYKFGGGGGAVSTDKEFNFYKFKMGVQHGVEQGNLEDRGNPSKPDSRWPVARHSCPANKQQGRFPKIRAVVLLSLYKGKAIPVLN
jgi:hypothetical protein